MSDSGRYLGEKPLPGRVDSGLQGSINRLHLLGPLSIMRRAVFLFVLCLDFVVVSTAVAESQPIRLVEPRAVEATLHFQGAIPVDADTRGSARVSVARALGYTLLPNVQIGVELGIGGSLDERIVSTADLFANGLLPLGERRTLYAGFRGGSLSYWWPDDGTWLGTLGAQLGVKWLVGSEIGIDAGLAYAAPPGEPERGWLTLRIGLAWVVATFPNRDQ